MTTIHTKFIIGQRVYFLSCEVVKQEVLCNVCSRTGSITMAGETFICPKCGGKSKTHRQLGYRNIVGGSGKIDQITAQLRAEHIVENSRKEICIYYVLDADVRTHWEEKDLFLTREEAEKECVRRNIVAQGKWEETMNS